MTLVSVLVAAYKATYLESALRSALAQTHGEIEVVVVDDSASSDVGETVARLGDARVRYLRNDANQGPAISYSRAITEASGPVIGVLNDDDLWESNLAARLLAALETTPEAVAAFADHWVIVNGSRDEAASDQNSRTWKREGLTPGLHRPFKRLALLDKSLPLAIAGLFRRHAVAGTPIPATVGGAYDLFLLYLLCRGGAGAVYVPERLASWRLHTASLSADLSCARAEEEAAVLGLLVADGELSEIKPALRAAYADALSCVATRNLAGGSRVRAASAALAAARLGHTQSLRLLPRTLLRSRPGSRPRAA